MALEKLYRQAVLEHNREPRNFYRMTDASHQALGNNALCGDEITVYLRLRGKTIEAASFAGESCAIATAAASMMSEWLPGRDTRDARRAALEFDRMLAGRQYDGAFLADNALLAGVAEFPSRIKSARLCWQAMLAALDGVAEISTENEND